jgi:hypothetical protein
VKDRWLTLLLAAGAFVAFYRFFIGSVDVDADEFSRPLSTETRANGYFALRRWLESERVPVAELRQRYDWLLRAPGIPERGNLLVTTIPHERFARPSEIGSLFEWVEKGNAVVVLAGLFDTPEWGMPDTDTPGTIQRISRIRVRDHEAALRAETSRREVAERKAREADGQPVPEETREDVELPAQPPNFVRLKEPKRHAMKPIADHPLLQGVRAVHAQSEYPAGTFDIVSPRNEGVLALMADADAKLAALWLTWVGDGSIVVSGYGSPFTNKMLAQADNAQLAANFVGAYVAAGGHVIFDDVHQGAASFYDAEAFFGDPRLHASFWWIVALWLVWVLGSTRLPPPAARPPPVREQDFVHRTGGFFARAVGRRQAAERMFANFFDDLRRVLGQLPHGRARWDWMRATGGIAAGDVARLEELHARVAAGRRVDLVELHNLLQQLRKQLA